MADRTVNDKSHSRPRGKPKRSNSGGPGRGPSRGGRDHGRDRDRRPSAPVVDVANDPESEIQASSNGPEIAIGDLKRMTMTELADTARHLNVEGYSGLKKQDLIFRILQQSIEATGSLYGEGTLEILPDGFG
ncbi:MAG: Rho termination factor N-terminal domain-containing protein, partial [Candidatus Hydrogenedentes bacterium]|nr:Rho termination factor N-terminal domain-containing protein [Candidatus Hydrogenedentota bacterium]